jgi:hypothetical protein
MITHSLAAAGFGHQRLGQGCAGVTSTGTARLRPSGRGYSLGIRSIGTPLGNAFSLAIHSLNSWRKTSLRGMSSRAAFALAASAVRPSTLNFSSASFFTIVFPQCYHDYTTPFWEMQGAVQRYSIVKVQLGQPIDVKVCLCLPRVTLRLRLHLVTPISGNSP